MKKRSRGVTIFGVIFIIGGTLGLIGQILVPWIRQSVGNVLTEKSVQLEPEKRQQLADASTVLISPQYRAVAGGTSTVRLATGVGLLMLQSWAYWLVLIIAGVSSIWMVANELFVGKLMGEFMIGPYWVYLILSLGWNGLIVWYFLRPSVKAQFVSKEQ